MFVFVSLESSVGQLFVYQQIINELLDYAFDSISLCYSSDSSATSYLSPLSKGQSSDKPRPMPCVMWNTTPDIQVFVTSRFDQVDTTNPDVKISSRLPNDYILKRLVPVYPRNPFDDKNKRSIVTISASAPSATITDTYLVLIPITTGNSKKLKRTSEYFDVDDLTYINDLMQQIRLEEDEEKAEIIRRLDPSSILHKGDIESSFDSLPRRRNCSIDPRILSSNQRICEWMNNSI